MKKIYESPILNITIFDEENVVVSSGVESLNSYGGAENIGKITLLDFVGDN